jgi:multiple sugar transport system ATP-binding protein
MADISVTRLRRTYPGGKAPATDDVSLSVADGEFVVLLGPSGCGKTTLLRLVAGLELPDAGVVRIGGRDVTYLPPRRRNLSMVFQSYAVFPHMKVSENIGFGLMMHKVDGPEQRRKVAWAAGLLQLEPYLGRYPSQLSGGQRQRVAVARAIVMEPDALLMDEPLSNLDALLRLNFRAELKKLLGDLGTTCLYVTHDQVEALSLGDRVAVMREGRIVQDGPPLSIYDNPVDEFVGGFIGSPPMNFLAATVPAGGSGRVEIGEQSLAGPAGADGLAGQPVRVGIRAEAIAPSVTPVDGALRAIAEVVEPLGSSVLLTAVLAGGGQQVKVQAPSDFRVDAGADLWLAVRPDRIRLYDPDSRRAIGDAPAAAAH